MNDSKRVKMKRIASAIMGLMMLIIVLFSAFYIAAEADHDCCGEDCPICACIRQCEITLRGIGDAQVARSVVAAPVVFVFPPAFIFIIAISRDTLVSRKVRMNN